MAMRAPLLLVFPALLLSTQGCLRQPRGTDARAAKAPIAEEAPGMRARIDELERELSARQAAATEASLGEADLTRKVDELAQLNAEMSERLKLSSEGVQQLAAERTRLSDELAQVRAKLGDEALGAIPASGGAPGADPAANEAAPSSPEAAPEAPPQLRAPAEPAPGGSDGEVAAVPEP
jgi:hypothetical protein